MPVFFSARIIVAEALTSISPSLTWTTPWSLDLEIPYNQPELVAGVAGEWWDLRRLIFWSIHFIGMLLEYSQPKCQNIKNKGEIYEFLMRIYTLFEENLYTCPISLSIFQVVNEWFPADFPFWTESTISQHGAFGKYPSPSDASEKAWSPGAKTDHICII